MRVAHIITRMIIGGAQENTLFNCTDLVQQHGDDVLLLTGPSLGPEGDLLQRAGLTDGNGVQIASSPTLQEDTDGSESPGTETRGRAGEFKIKCLPHLRRNIHPLHDWKGAGELRAALKAFQPDVVHTHSAKGGLLGRKVAWEMKVPAVIHSVHGAPFHAYQPKWAREFFRRCERWAAKRCHHMICVADAMTDLMVDANVAQRSKFTTISSGMDVDPFLNANLHREIVRSRLGVADDQVVIGKIARLFHLKGHEDLVTAAEKVIKQCPKVVFLLIGDGILREPLTRQIESLGMSDHFVFTGLVPPSEVPSLIGAMDILVHTSYREGLARALPQALIAGKPAVSYDVDGAREVVISGETGCLVPPQNIPRLAESLVELAQNRQEREKLGREGQLRFTEQFRHQTMTAQIRELYQRILERS